MARDNMGGRLIVTQKALHEATAIRIAAQQGLNGSRSIRRTPTQTRTSQYVDQMRHQCVTGRALVALQYRARAPRDLTNSIVLANVCSGGDCSHLRVACLADRASSNARFVFSVILRDSTHSCDLGTTKIWSSSSRRSTGGDFERAKCALLLATRF